MLSPPTLAIQTPAVRHLTSPASYDLVDHASYLGVCPSADIAAQISTFRCQPVAPYAAIAAVDDTVDDTMSGAMRRLLQEVPMPSATFLKTKFCIDFEVPSTREVTQQELNFVLALSIEDVEGVDVFARLPSGALRTFKQQLDYFVAHHEDRTTTVPLMMHYLRTRGQNRQLNRAAMVDLVIAAMEDEVRTGYFAILLNPSSGRQEKTRRHLLVHHGVLTHRNAPGLLAFPVDCPHFDDAVCRFASREDFADIYMLQVIQDWNDRFFQTYAVSSGHLRNAMDKVNARRAYYFRVVRKDAFMFVQWRVDRSRVKEATTVLLSWRMPVGRDADAMPELVSTNCTDCVAGDNHPGSSHIMTGMSGIAMLRSGDIVPGDIGDGAKAWGGPGRLSSAPVQSIDAIAHLTGTSILTQFTSFQRKAPPLVSQMERYLTRFTELSLCLVITLLPLLKFMQVGMSAGG